MKDFLELIGYAMIGWVIGMLLTAAFLAIFPTVLPAVGVAAAL